MAQIVDKPGLQELIGTGLGQGLSAGLQGLVNQKLAQMQQGKLTQSLQALQGWSPQESQVFPLLPQQVQSQFIKQKLQAPQQQAYAQALSSLFGGGGEGIQKQVGPEQQVAKQPVNLSGGITDKQLGDIARIYQKQQQIGQKERMHGEKRYEKLISPLRESYDKNQQLNNYYDAILELSDLSDVPRGLIPALGEKLGISNSLYADTLGETLDKLLKGNIVRKAALTGKSRGAGEKLIKTLSESEGSLKNSKEGLKAIIQSQKNLEVYPDIIKYKIANDLSNKYISAGKSLPNNFLELVNNKKDEEVSKRFNELIKELKRVKKGSEPQYFDEIPNAADYPGQDLEFPDGTIKTSINGQWISKKDNYVI